MCQVNNEEVTQSGVFDIGILIAKPPYTPLCLCIYICPAEAWKSAVGYTPCLGLFISRSVVEQLIKGGGCMDISRMFCQGVLQGHRVADSILDHSTSSERANIWLHRPERVRELLPPPITASMTESWCLIENSMKHGKYDAANSAVMVSEASRLHTVFVDLMSPTARLL